MRAACGEILVILNADVHLPRDFLRRLEAHYAAGADYVLVENAVENIEYLLPRYMQAQHSYQYGVDTAVNMNWTEGFSCRRQAALDAGLQPEGGVVPLVAGEDGWFGERLQARGFRKVFDRSLVATHVAPAQWRSFWAQRVGRGQGTAQMWRQRENNSLVVLVLRSFIAEPYKIPSSSMMPPLVSTRICRLAVRRLSSTKRAKQRAPLPHCSTSEPSELKIR
ncbi:MAG: hypothetical protein RL334_1693 [Chloroflexota bacterium]